MLPVLKAGERTTINIGSTDDFVDAYDMKITKIDEEKE